MNRLWKARLYRSLFIVGYYDILTIILIGFVIAILIFVGSIGIAKLILDL